MRWRSSEAIWVKECTLAGESINILILDTFVALMAGLIIIPACFAFQRRAGCRDRDLCSSLCRTYSTRWQVEDSGELCFSCLCPLRHCLRLSRYLRTFCPSQWICGAGNVTKQFLFNIVLLIILSMPAILGFGPWSGIQILGEGTNIMDLEDFIISNNILPLGSVIFVIFCASKNGWGWDNFIKEANTGKGIKFPTCIRNYMLWVIPVVVAIIYLKGYYDMFQPKGNTYLIPWMIVGIAMLILVGWIVFGHSKKNKK